MLIFTFIMGLRTNQGFFFHNPCCFSNQCWTLCSFIPFEAISSYPTGISATLPYFKEQDKIFFFHFHLNFDNVQEVNETAWSGKDIKNTPQAKRNSSLFLNGSSLALTLHRSFYLFGLFPLRQRLFLPPVIRRIFCFPFSFIRRFFPSVGLLHWN